MILDHATATKEGATREFLRAERGGGRYTQVETPIRSDVVLTQAVLGSPVLSETLAKRAEESVLS